MLVLKVEEAMAVSICRHWHSDGERGDERGTASIGLSCMPRRALDMPVAVCGALQWSRVSSNMSAVEK